MSLYDPNEFPEAPVRDDRLALGDPLRGQPALALRVEPVPVSPLTGFDQAQLAHQFLDWCRTVPADRTYCYLDNGGCAFAQFLSASGLARRPSVGDDYWRDHDAPGEGWRKEHLIPGALVEPLKVHPRTFGALASRLESALAEEGVV